MAQETTEPQGKSGRPKWMGYAQLVLILAAIGVAPYFAQAPAAWAAGDMTAQDQAQTEQ